MSDLLFPCSGDACLAGESDHSSQQNKQAYRDFGCLQDTFLGSGCKGDPGTLLQTVGLHSNGGVLTRVCVHPRLDIPGTLEVMGPTHCQRKDAASQGSHLLLYLEQGGVK